MSLFPYQGPNPAKGSPDQPRPIITVEMVPRRFDDRQRPDANRRVNVKAMVILGLAFVAIPILYFAISRVQDGRLRRQALELAREASERGDVDRALTVLETWLQKWPEDIQALEQVARLRTDSARTLNEVLAAAEAQDLLLRVDPMGPGRQDNRRDLVRLYIHWGDGLRLASTRMKATTDKLESRSRAAVKIAQQRLAYGSDDAESHRLLAMSLESLGVAGDAQAMAESTVEYEKALRRDPADVGSAERLARIIYERGNDTHGPDEILDELLQAAPQSVDVRLARYRFFTKTDRLDRAKLELEKATALAPADPNVRMLAAAEMIARRDTTSARRHLDAIDATKGEDRRLSLFRGFLEVADKNPDVAIEVWRKGLLASSGTDQDLTWRLAFILVQLGRFSEAGPLVDQYRRLAGEEDPMLHLLRGLWDEKIGRPSSAIAELKGLGPSIPEVWAPDLALTLGRAFEKIRDDAQAMTEYRKAIKAVPRSLEARRALARLLKKDDPDAAARELEAAIARSPSEPSPAIDLAVIRLEQQLATPPSERKWSKVTDVLDRASTPGTTELAVLLIRAEVLSANGEGDRASSLLEAAANGPDRARDDLWLSWANSLARSGRVARAIQVLARASEAGNAGDHASLRIARATLLLAIGKGREARDWLTKGIEGLPVSERIELARARARTVQLLGDQAAARDACLEWARLAPLEPAPGLALLDLSRRNSDEEAARLGLKVLQDVGGEDEPYALAARAIDLLQSARSMVETRSSRLELASGLSNKLSLLAPKLPVSHLVRAMVLERNHRLEEAIVDYRIALEGDTADLALGRLTSLLSRLKRFDDLAALKEKVDGSIGIDRIAARLAIEQGEYGPAERVASRLAEGRPDDGKAREAQALLLLELGKPEAAEEALRALVDRGPDRPDSWAALVTFQAAQGLSKKAAESIERASKRYRGPRPDLLQARLRGASGDLDAASKLYDSAVAAHPDDPSTLRAAGDFFEAAGLLERAEVLARRALAIPSCSAWAARDLARRLSKRPDPAAWLEAWGLVAPGGPGAGDLPGDRLLRASLLEASPDPARRLEAEATLASLVEDLPASLPVAIRARVALASLLFRSGRRLEAAEVIAPATKEGTPDEPDALTTAVEILARTGRLEEADQRLARLAVVAPESPGTICGRAWVSLARGQVDEAVATIERAASAAENARNGPAKFATYFHQLVNMNQAGPAERLARQIARLWPKDAWVLAGLLDGLGRTDEALDACRASAEAGATAEPMKLALALVLRGRLDGPQGEKARAVADDVVATRPDDATLRHMAILIANRQGRPDDALAICRRAFEADPSNPTCLNDLNDMAWLLGEELGRPVEALREVDRVLKVSALPSAMDTRGVLLTRLGRFDEAIDQLERCVRLEPVGNRFLHLARAYQKAGKLEPYRSTLDRARKAGISPDVLTPKEKGEFASLIAN